MFSNQILQRAFLFSFRYSSLSWRRLAVSGWHRRGNSIFRRRFLRRRSKERSVLLFLRRRGHREVGLLLARGLRRRGKHSTFATRGEHLFACWTRFVGGGCFLSSSFFDRWRREIVGGGSFRMFSGFRSWSLQSGRRRKFFR